MSCCIHVVSCRMDDSHLLRHVCNAGSSVRWNMSHGMSCLDVFHMYVVGWDGMRGMLRDMSIVMMGEIVKCHVLGRRMIVLS
jgi:hypothetical protein